MKAPVAGKIVARNAKIGAIATAAGAADVRASSATARWNCAPMWPKPTCCGSQPGQTAHAARRRHGRCADRHGAAGRADDRPDHPPWPRPDRGRRRRRGCAPACSSRPRSWWPNATALAVPVTAIGSIDRRHHGDARDGRRWSSGCRSTTGIRDGGYGRDPRGPCGGRPGGDQGRGLRARRRPDQPGPAPAARTEGRCDELLRLVDPQSRRAAPGLLPADGAGLASFNALPITRFPEHRRAAGRGHRQPVRRRPGRDGKPGHQGDRGCRRRASPASRTSPRP